MSHHVKSLLDNFHRRLKRLEASYLDTLRTRVAYMKDTMPSYEGMQKEIQNIITDSEDAEKRVSKQKTKRDAKFNKRRERKLKKVRPTTDGGNEYGDLPR